MSKATKVIGAKIPEKMYLSLQAEAEGKGKSVSDFLREILTEREELKHLKADIEALIAGHNADLTEAIGVIVRAEMRGYQDELKASRKETRAFQEETAATLAQHGKALEFYLEKLQNLHKGVVQILAKLEG